MNILNKVVQTAKWADGLPRRCGACLFELDATAKPASFDIHVKWERLFWTSDTHTTPFSKFVRSAHRGCARCAAIIGFFERTGIQCNAIEWSPSRGWNSAQPQVNCQVSDDPGDVIELDICVSPEDFDGLIVEGISAAHPSICRGARLVGGTGDSGPLAQAAKWLEKCREKHPGCRKGDDRFVPTRLLHIGGQDATRIELCERLASPLTYAALSHHWSAETQAVILKTTNLEERKRDGIPISDLPWLMQDVVTALRGLGLAYVWIDSLCILQDSSDDWQTEAAMMANVYSNAEVTIAATWCHGSGQSLFSSRKGDEFIDADIPGVGGRSPLMIRRSTPHFHWKNSTPEIQWDNENSDSVPQLFSTGNDSGGNVTAPPAKTLWPLLGRGWVYQEQWLSRRTLHFTEHELVWICSETTACECSFYEFGKGSRHGPSAFNETRSWEWTGIVEQYSERVFTQITDRLPALAGIATVHSDSQARGQYLCGLWSKELPKTLFWQSTNSTVSPRPSITMPTWSWASVTGSIEFGYPDEEMQPKILDIHVSYKGRDIMGDVSQAVLRLEGLLVVGRALHGEKWRHVLTTEGKAIAETNPESSHGLEIDGRFSTFVPDYAIGTPGKHFVPDDGPVACLLFSQGTVMDVDPEHPENNRELNYVSGLVLRSISEGGSLYERIGFFAGSGFDDSFELERLLAFAQKREFTLV